MLVKKLFIICSFAVAAACSGNDSPGLDPGDESTSDADGAETSTSSVDAHPEPDDPPPPDAPPELTPENDTFADRIADVVAQVDGSGTKAQIIAVDENGVAIGVLVTWVDQNGAPNVEANFQDGYLDVVVIEGEPIVKATLPPDVLAARAEAMALKLSYAAQDGAVGCAVSVSIAVGLCAPLALGQWWGVVTCPAGVVNAFCKCAPVLGLEDGGICEEL